MRTYFILFMLTGCLLGSQLLSAQTPSRKKVGVVLSGGGAKGSAHIGVLRAIEEAGIPVDYIAGTSMGAVIGGLYAIGYTPNQLDSIIKGQDWTFLLSDQSTRKKQTLQERDNASRYLISIPLVKARKPEVSGLVRGRNLANLLTKLTIGYHDSVDFNKLPIPFACVATNIVDGAEYVFRQGKLSSAIRSSMAIPGVFTPVRMDDMILVDGGLVNNYPVDVARKMGADIVIGATVQGELPVAEDINNVSDILSQIISISCRNKYEENIANSDLHLRIDTEGFSTMDFKPEVIDSMIRRGWNTAQLHKAELAAIRKELFPAGEAETDTPKTLSPVSVYPQDSIFVRKITYQIGNKHELKTVALKCKIRANRQVSISQIEEAIHILQDEFNYPDTYYTLSENDGRYDLVFHGSNKNESSFKAGVRFDSEEVLSAIVRGEFYFKTAMPSSLSLTGRVGRQYMARVDYTFEPFLHRNLNIAYEFRRNDMNIYKEGTRLYNLLFREHAGEIRLTDQSVRNLRFEVGLRIEHYDFNDLLTNRKEVEVPELVSDTYFNYFATVKYNSQNRSYFPTSGVDFKAGYTLYTDDFLHCGDGSPVSAIDASWTGAFSANSHFTLSPFACGRVLLGSNAPHVYSNITGGYYAGRYISHQLPFVGIANAELMDAVMLIGGVKLQQRIHGEHYVSLLGNVALNSDRLSRLDDARFLYGIGLQYGCNTKLGPIEAALSYSNNSKKLLPYVNLGYYF